MGNQSPEPTNVGNLKGLVFVRTNDQKEYGPMRAYGPYTQPHPLEDSDYFPFAEDGCGNAFLRRGDGCIFFWDHETDELTELARDWDSFVASCKPPTPIVFDRSKIKSVWIDPDFAKKLREQR